MNEARRGSAGVLVPPCGSEEGKMRRSAVVLVLLLAACGGGDDRPGSDAVYAAIDAETSCVALQETFDRNMADVERREPSTAMRAVVLSYAKAANDRMRFLGC